jgi:hypothetical protein
MASFERSSAKSSVPDIPTVLSFFVLETDRVFSKYRLNFSIVHCGSFVFEKLAVLGVRLNINSASLLLLVPGSAVSCMDRHSACASAGNFDRKVRKA